MADTRSRADKLRDVMNAPSATEGERKNARRLLERMGESTAAPSGPRGGGNDSEHVDWTDDHIWTTDDNINFDDFIRRYAQWGSQRTYYAGFDPNRPFAQGWQRTRVQGETPEQVRERIRKMAEELDKQQRTTYSAAQQREHARGVHAWVVVGQNVDGGSIHRCIICGEYKKEAKRGQGKRGA